MADDRFLADGESFGIPLHSATKLAGRGRLLVRPHALRLVAEGRGLRGRVSNVRALAGRTTLEIELAQQDARIELDLDASHAGVMPARGSLVDVLPTPGCVFVPD